MCTSYLLLHNKLSPTCSNLQQPFFYEVSEGQESRSIPSIPPALEAISKTPIHRRGVWPPAHHHPCARCLRVWFQPCASTWACMSRCPHKHVRLPVRAPDRRDPSSLYPSNVVCLSFLFSPLFISPLFSCSLCLISFEIVYLFVFCGCAGSLVLFTGVLQLHRQAGATL